MSTSTSAEVFYGFTFPREQRTDAAEYDRDPDVKLGIIGSDGDITDFVCAKASYKSVSLGDCYRVGLLHASMPPWNVALERFCKRHGIAWPESGPAWHIAPLRL